MKYKHTQFGWVMLFVVLVLLFIAPMFLVHNRAMYFGIYIFFVIATLIWLLFLTLTITVDESFIVAVFGVGLIRKKIAVKDVVSCRKVRTKWYNGWGIHGCPGRGWLYNVSGFDALELVMKDGMKYYFGSDDIDALHQNISILLAPSSR